MVLWVVLFFQTWVLPRIFLKLRLWTMRWYRARPAITITSWSPAPYPPAEPGPSHSKSHPPLAVRLFTYVVVHVYEVMNCWFTCSLGFFDCGCSEGYMDCGCRLWLLCGRSDNSEIHGYRITRVLGLIPGPVLTYFILCCWPVLCCWPAHWNLITEIVPVKGIEPELCFLCGWRGGVL